MVGTSLNGDHSTSWAARRTKWLMLGFLTGALMAATLGLIGVNLHARHNLSRLVVSVLQPSERQSVSLKRTFAELNALTMLPCSEKHLAAMRVQAFRSNFIRDVAYVNNGRLICSSGLGSLVQSILSRPPPDFITAGGRLIRRNLELVFAPGIRSTAVEEGHYSVLVTPIQYPSFVESNYIKMTVVLINRLTGATLAISGPDLHLGIASMRDHAFLFQNNKMMAIACISSGNSCIILSREPRALFAEYWAVLSLIVAAGACLGGLSTALIFSGWAYSKSLPVQLKKAINRNELAAHYQPIFDARTGQIVSAEALIRWTLPNGESVSPDVFIPAAEKAGIIGKITRSILQIVTRELCDILQLHETFRVSINITSHDLADPLFHTALRETVIDRGLRPSQIALELTERSAVEGSIEIEATHHLHAQGYEIYIDDFGTGYSNISYINSLAAQKIKLDKSFTAVVCTDSVRSRLVPPILTMAQELGLTVVVEGIEREDQVRYFQERGVHLMQGWFFARAMPIEQLIIELERTYGPMH